MDIINKILGLISKEIMPAEGCTEPIALAYAASRLTDTLKSVPDTVVLHLSGNLVKNIKSVFIPGSGGMAGIEAATALGLILGDHTKGLMVLSCADWSKLDSVKRYINERRINVERIEGDAKLHIRIYGVKGAVSGMLEIKDFHTNIIRVEKNQEVIFSKELDNDGNKEDTSLLTMEFIYNFINTEDLSAFKDLCNNIKQLNKSIALEGLKNEYGAAVGKTIAEGIKEGIYENSLKNRIISYTATASDARMGGCPLPVVSACGSGNQGITATIPVIIFCEERHYSGKELVKGLLFSLLTLIHIKNFTGRLSAYCGAVCAGAATAAAITYLQKGTPAQIAYSIETTLETLSGLACCGANSSCPAKIASCVSTALDSSMMALKNRKFKPGDGLIGNNIEDTLSNIGILACNGLKVTDDVILEIMLKN